MRIVDYKGLGFQDFKIGVSKFPDFFGVCF